jgi:hypothetical protein
MKRLLTILILLGAVTAPAQSVKLAWDASPSPGIASYRIYFGTNSGRYAYSTNVGLVRTQTVVLPRTGRWFFAATATDTNGIESLFSNEVQTEVRPKSPAVHGESWVRLTPVIERSTNLVNWRSVEGEATWIAATNAMEFFATRRLVIEQVQRVREP